MPPIRARHAGSFGSVRLARRVVTGEGPPYKEYAVKALSKQRLRRMKKSVVTGADGRMVVKTGEDMVSAVGGCGAVGAHEGVLGVVRADSIHPGPPFPPHRF